MLNKILFLLIGFKKDTVKYLLSLIKKINIKFPKINLKSHPSKTKSNQTDQIICEVQEFLFLLQKECQLYLSETQRFTDIKNEIKATGTYWQTYDELAYGAKLAWRNSTRCIGRNYWDLLAVSDYRSLNKPDEIFDALVEHLRLATNEGRIKPLITVFAPQEPNQPGIRIWNEQLIRYAGYKQSDGSIIGDPKYVEFTKIVHQMGWKGSKGTPFDILPIVIQMPNQQPHLFELPPDVVLEVSIQHPEYPWFAELGLRWHAVPLISNMMLDIGGLKYTSAPFNGWYMGTEIGSRNFGDESRYNLLFIVAQKLGLNPRSSYTLWRDRALVELNVAVLYSFQKAGVTIVDHHTESRHFIQFENKEKLNKRCAYADWSWIVPPMSGSATPVFHRTYENIELKPNFFYQPDPWQQSDVYLKLKCPVT
ncbi:MULTISPECIES: nitric oxide synthase oxygenase [Nostocales]|uniref:nitric oxide synthase oxygenase n=1 Tax=Nostocales TaxID=1161 RepID=UPI00029B5E9E|nr:MULTISPECIES: nitric oxide synthase oxygenase [Nostocales]AFW93496.1 nitric oxide synthase oxygenase subunit [Anabaena sp. 90]MTJ17262.1 nitric oxide synthase oxygenase [Dolichospermum sp. UHCC 0299]MTJ20482.1 nitric oxide synthase oxygenase [Dolichospermum sp. UHCC 0352]MTJ40093.1 nitric oxide synthase oxygenase [Dolichospermum sp. UHCC 0406]